MNQAFADDDQDRIAALELDFRFLLQRRGSEGRPKHKAPSRRLSFRATRLEAAAMQDARAAQLIAEAEHRVWTQPGAVELVARARRAELLAQVSRDLARVDLWT